MGKGCSASGRSVSRAPSVAVDALPGRSWPCWPGSPACRAPAPRATRRSTTRSSRRTACREPRERVGRRRRRRPGIQGFATDISVNQGETVGFKVDTDASNYRLDIYRMGYYGGTGARKVATVHAVGRAAADPAGLPDRRGDRPRRLRQLGASRRRGRCRPRDVRHLLRQARPRRDTGGASHIVFVVRDDDGSPTCCSRPPTRPGRPTTATAATACTRGSLRPGRAYKVSYNRPFTTRGNGAERLGLQRRVPDGALARSQRLRRQLHHRRRHRPPRRRAARAQGRSCRSATTSTGRAQQRANVEAARDAGVNLAFFSGNEVFWKTRWENSIDGSARRTARSSATRRRTPTPRSIRSRRLDRHLARPALQPASRRRPAGERAHRHDLHRQRPAPTGDRGPGRRRQAALLAQHARRRRSAGGSRDARRRHARLRVGRGPRQRLPPGRPDPPVVDDRERVDRSCSDYGSTYGAGTATHTLTLYRARRAARSSSAPARSSGRGGSTATTTAATPRRTTSMQQATVNLFADMGVQPASLQAGLVGGDRVDRHDAAPTRDRHLAGRRARRSTSRPPVTISGTATDAGGGRVGGVEVSVDGGTTWQPATGRETWTLHLDADRRRRRSTLRSRAVDDSGNIERAGRGGRRHRRRADLPVLDVRRPDARRRLRSRTRTPRGRARHEVPRRPTASSPASASTRAQRTGTHIGNLWTERRRAARAPARSPANRRRLAAGASRRRSPCSRTRPTSSRITRASGTTRPTPASSHAARAPRPCRRRPAPTASTATAAASRRRLQRQQLLGRRRLRARRHDAAVGHRRRPGRRRAGVDRAAPVRATFNEPVNAATVPGGTFELRNARGALVPATVTYTAATRTATLRPGRRWRPETSIPRR